MIAPSALFEPTDCGAYRYKNVLKCRTIQR